MPALLQLSLSLEALRDGFIGGGDGGDSSPLLPMDHLSVIDLVEVLEGIIFV